MSILSIVVSAGLLFAMTGCGEENSSASAQKMVENKVPAVPVKERKAAFDKEIQNLKMIGFDLNTTEAEKQKTTYILQIADSQKAVTALLSKVHMATLDKQSKRQLAQLFEGAKIGIDVDWEKYAQNAEQSVFIYYLGNGKESAVLRKLIAEKKIGAYLTFDAKDTLRKAVLKAIDEKIAHAAGSIHLVLKEAKLLLHQAASDSPEERNYTLDAGQFLYTQEHNGTKLFQLNYDGFVCTAVQENAYLGTWQCKISEMVFKSDENNSSGTFSVNGVSLDYKSTQHGQKIKGDFRLTIPAIALAFKEGTNMMEATVKDYSIVGGSDNADANLMKEIYAIAGTSGTDANKTYSQYMRLIGQLMASGMTFDIVATVPSLTGKIAEGADITHFSVLNQKGEAKGLFGKTIEYQSLTSIEEIRAFKEKASNPFLLVKGARYGLEIKDLYNFLPDFMVFSGMVAGKDPASTPLTKEEREKLSAIGMQIVHHGVALALGPVGMDSAQFEQEGKQYKYSQMNLDLDATLLKNSVKLDNPMSAMMLLSYLQADGKLVLSKADLDSMSNRFPPQVMAMVMMYAKYEGDKAIFVLKFENGHLMVNGKPVM